MEVTPAASMQVLGIRTTMAREQLGVAVRAGFEELWARPNGAAGVVIAYE